MATLLCGHIGTVFHRPPPRLLITNMREIDFWLFCVSRGGGTFSLAWTSLGWSRTRQPVLGPALGGGELLLHHLVLLPPRLDAPHQVLLVRLGLLHLPAMGGTGRECNLPFLQNATDMAFL